MPPAWLERERKANPALRVFAVSWNKVEEYEQGHVPGSFYVDTNLFETPPIWDLIPRDKLVEALLSLEGARCISLGTQTPLLEIAHAAAAHHADIVALSFSAAFPARQVPNLLRQLRDALPATTMLWAGGSGVRRIAAPEGVCVAATLDDGVTALAGWRSAHKQDAAASDDASA